MGLLDKFKSIYGQKKKKTAKPMHAVGDKDNMKKRFMSVGSAVDSGKKKDVKDTDDNKADSKKKESDTSAKKKSSRTPLFAPKVLVRPLITEKMSSHPGRYAFEVHPNANRDMVKRAINDLYGILPTKVNIMHQSGKAVRYGRSVGVTKNWKKAVVTLPEGKTIEVFES
ncbi:50S ribosomal protein L23 [Patescibacteria group bacterium]